jgi:CBS-domain-containing membrane protein
MAHVLSAIVLTDRSLQPAIAQITQTAALALFYGAAVPNLREQLQGHISGRPVVNASGKLIGIVSQGDFTRRGNGEAAVAVSACSFDPLSWGIGVQN